MKNQLSFGLLGAVFVLAYSYYMAANALQLQLNLYSNALNLQPLMEFGEATIAMFKQYESICQQLFVPGPVDPHPSETSRQERLRKRIELRKRRFDDLLVQTV